MSIECNITDAEFEVMNIVWELGETTSREVSDILIDKMDWKQATIKTLLGRLVKKEALATKKDGNRFIYTANIPKTMALKNTVEEFTSKICSKSIGEIIGILIENNDLSFEDKEKIEKILKEKKAVKEVVCNCIS